MRNEQGKLGRVTRRRTESEAIFGRDRRVERELIPIGQGVACFEGETAVARSACGMFNLVLKTDGDTRR